MPHSEAPNGSSSYSRIGHSHVRLRDGTETVVTCIPLPAIRLPQKNAGRDSPGWLSPDSARGRFAVVGTPGSADGGGRWKTVRTSWVAQRPLRDGFHRNPATGPSNATNSCMSEPNPSPPPPTLPRKPTNVFGNTVLPAVPPLNVVGDIISQTGASTGWIWEHDYVWYIDGDRS
jgi:hypothetical protein